MSQCDPNTYEEAVKHKEWRHAMDEKYNALIRNQTWSLVSPLSHKTIIACKWTYKIKRNSDGTISRYKARLIAKGYTQ